MSISLQTLFSIDGRTALVTGGNDGIGKMIASVFVHCGAKVIIVGRKEEKTLAAAAELARQGPGQCRGIAADLSALEDIRHLAATLADQHPEGIDILINNAGTTWGAPIEDFPEKGWDKVMDLNLKGSFYLTEALIPLLAKAASDENWSRIINISSVGARLLDKDIASPPYAASKAGIEQLTRILAAEHAREKITVNCIAPGWFPTALTATVDWAAEQWRAKTPLKRLGTMEDIGGLAVFLCSPAGAYITGQVIDIDGGRSL